MYHPKIWFTRVIFYINKNMWLMRIIFHINRKYDYTKSYATLAKIWLTTVIFYVSQTYDYICHIGFFFFCSSNSRESQDTKDSQCIHHFGKTWLIIANYTLQSIWLSIWLMSEATRQKWLNLVMFRLIHSDFCMSHIFWFYDLLQSYFVVIKYWFCCSVNIRRPTTR